MWSGTGKRLATSSSPPLATTHPRASSLASRTWQPAYGLSPGNLLGETELIIHGTTVATSTLVERKGAKVGLLTTEGFKDLLEMREGLKEDRYNLRMTPVAPLVPRYLRLGVTAPLPRTVLPGPHWQSQASRL